MTGICCDRGELGPRREDSSLRCLGRLARSTRRATRGPSRVCRQSSSGLYLATATPIEPQCYASLPAEAPMTEHAPGRIEHVPLRDVWEHEALAFTPWLAANLDLVARELGVAALDRVDEEVAVGNFSLDILARTHDGRLVVIENQLESTDHTHLGQLLTYASGLGASIIVWVSSKVRDEHQSALTWLNENTGGDVHFFALEVGAVRIGDSLPAPVFNVRVRPNDWQESTRRSVAASAQIASSEEWLEEVAARRPASLAAMQAVADHWRQLGGYFDFGSGSVFLTSPLAAPPGHGVWAFAIYSGGKVEVVFQHLARRSVFTQEAKREELRTRLNAIPGVTPLPADVLERRPGFDMQELETPDALEAFLDVLTWFHTTVQVAEGLAGE